MLSMIKKKINKHFFLATYKPEKWHALFIICQNLVSDSREATILAPWWPLSATVVL